MQLRLRVKNATKASSRINKFLASSMYHHLSLFLHVIQQIYFTSLKVMKRELQSKTWEIHTITLFIPLNCSSKGITQNSRDRKVQTTKKFKILSTYVLSPPLMTYMILAQRSITICSWHKFALDLSYCLNLKCILPERLLFNLVTMWHKKSKLVGS